jgi:hypothetical protein
MALPSMGGCSWLLIRSIAEGAGLRSHSAAEYSRPIFGLLLE